MVRHDYLPRCKQQLPIHALCSTLRYDFDVHLHYQSVQSWILQPLPVRTFWTWFFVWYGHRPSVRSILVPRQPFSLPTVADSMDHLQELTISKCHAIWICIPASVIQLDIHSHPVVLPKQTDIPVIIISLCKERTFGMNTATWFVLPVLGIVILIWQR